MKDNVCPNCGSSDIIRGAEVRDYDSQSYRPLSVYVPLLKPEGGFFKKTAESSELRTSVCGGCGYTALFAPNFQTLLKATR